MKNYKLRKAAYLAVLSSMLLSGCGKKEETETIKKEEPTTEKIMEYDLNLGVVSNQTFAKVIEEYETKTGKKIKDYDIEVAKLNEPKYVWKDKDGNYIYDYRIPYDEGYEYVSCRYKDMAVVKINTHKDGETWYMPICALLETSSGIVNVKVTTLDSENRIHDPYEDYIYVDNPTNKSFRELLDYEEYINAKYKEPVFYVAPKEYKYKSN